MKRLIVTTPKLFKTANANMFKSSTKSLNTLVIQIFDENMQVLKDKGLHLVIPYI